MCHDLQGQLKALQLVLACITGSGSWQQLGGSTQHNSQETTLCEVATQTLQALAGKRHIRFERRNYGFCLSALLMITEPLACARGTALLLRSWVWADGVCCLSVQAWVMRVCCSSMACQCCLRAQQRLWATLLASGRAGPAWWRFRRWLRCAVAPCTAYLSLLSLLGLTRQRQVDDAPLACRQ